MEGILRRCGYTESFIRDPNGLAGGLALGWKDYMKVTVKEHDNFFIYFVVTDQTNQLEWGVCVVHLHSSQEVRLSQYEKLL